MAPERTGRYQQIDVGEPSPKFLLGTAVRATLAQGYGFPDLRADLVAGLIVGIVSIPLSMALAIAAGVPPQFGLYTAAVGGVVAALLGGSRLNISGMSASFVVILAPIAQEFGLAGLTLASLMAGVILIAMGISGFGQWIQFIPYPVTAGFTAGVGVVIAVYQLNELLGIPAEGGASGFLSRAGHLIQDLPKTSVADLSVGLITLAALLVWPHLTRRVPAPLIGVIVGTAAGFFLPMLWPALQPDTIGTRFTFTQPDGTLGAGLPATSPRFLWPWNEPGPAGVPLALTWDLWRALIPKAFAIAMLGAIESLLSAVVADGLTGHKHHSDAELVGQGAANLIAPLFGGFAVTGAIARTATNVRAGGRSPLAGITHGVFIVAAMGLGASLLSHLPMATMAALLLVVAWNMCDVKHLWHVLRMAPRSDVLVLVTCFGLTVVFDMVIAVSVGVVLAALGFMKRMASLSNTRLFKPGRHPHIANLPADVLYFEIAGPLFFGAANKAANTLGRVPMKPRLAILDMSAVPAMDVTGLVALETAVQRLLKNARMVVIAGVQAEPLELLRRSSLPFEAGRLQICETISEVVPLITPSI